MGVLLYPATYIVDGAESKPHDMEWVQHAHRAGLPADRAAP
jgi:hypothetical protein